MNFRELGLTAPILRALDEQGYEIPTPIQTQAIPPALAGRDVLGCAQTGTGKTCAFACPILQRLTGRNCNPRRILALILTPTRELAMQIGDCFTAYGKHLSLRSAVIFGGVGQQPQADRLRAGVDILVATPGRLLDLQGQGLLDLSHVEIFVLDEAGLYPRRAPGAEAPAGKKADAVLLRHYAPRGHGPGERPAARLRPGSGGPGVLAGGGHPAIPLLC